MAEIIKNNDIARGNLYRNQQKEINIQRDEKQRDSTYSFAKDPTKLTENEVNTERKDKQSDSTDTFAKDPAKLTENEVNTERKDKQRDSTDTFAKDPDKLIKNEEYDNVRNQNKNVWPQITANTDYLNPNAGMPDEILSSSARTNASYAVINDIHVDPVGVKRKEKGCSTRTCRIIQGASVFTVVAVLGLIAFFIVRNMLHEEENESRQHQQTDCGPFPTVTNGRITGTEKISGSIARLQCNPGFMINATTSITCMCNGSWSCDKQPKCIPHPCGLYNLSENAVVREDFSHANMTIRVRCEDGFDFANNSQTEILCENDTWIGSPRCEIPGILRLKTKNTSPLILGESLSMACHLSNSPNWEIVQLTRTDTGKDSSSSQILIVIYNNGTTDKHYNAAYFKSSVTHLSDGVLVNLSVNQVQCADTGVYSCVVLVGSLTSPRGIKTEEKAFKVIDTTSAMRNITAPTSVVQGDEITVKCVGSIGMDENGMKLGEINIKIYKDENSIDAHSLVVSSHVQGCQIVETVNATIVVTNEMNGAELQCLLIDKHGDRYKRSVLLNVTTTTVKLLTSSSVVYIGDSVSVTAELNYIRGWSAIEFRKICRGSSVVISSTQTNQSISNSTMEEHIVLARSDITETSARMVLNFTSVRCSDACGEGGEIEYTCAVKIEDSWASGSVKIEFRMTPTEPIISRAQFYQGQEAAVTCTGNVGIPAQEIIMKENDERLDSDLRNLDTKVNFNKDTCENVTTITYTFTATNDKDGNTYQCETSFNNGVKASDVEIVNVTDPILYFSDESMTGLVGSMKTMQCVLTSAINFTNVVISRYGSEEILCEVNSTGVGTCDVKGFSASGMFSDDGNSFITTMILGMVSCNNEVQYGCSAVVGFETFKTTMDFQVKSTHSRPELRIPVTIVEDQMAEYEDELNCTAQIGYPSEDRQLKIQIKTNSSDMFKDYPVPPVNGGTCGQIASIVKKQAVFTAEENGSIIRCVILDKDDNEIIASSEDKEIHVLKNICLSGAAGEYDPHPYNCRRYIRCVGERLYDLKCASGACATGDTDPICSNNGCTECP